MQQTAELANPIVEQPCSKHYNENYRHNATPTTHPVMAIAGPLDPFMPFAGFSVMAKNGVPNIVNLFIWVRVSGSFVVP